MKREYKILTALVVSSLMGFSAMTAEAEALTLTGSITDTKITGNSDTGDDQREYAECDECVR